MQVFRLACNDRAIFRPSLKHSRIARAIKGGREIVQNFRRKSALTLLETGILLVDDEALALSDHDLAVSGTALDARTNLHGVLLLLSVFRTDALQSGL